MKFYYPKEWYLIIQTEGELRPNFSNEPQTLYGLPGSGQFIAAPLGVIDTRAAAGFGIGRCDASLGSLTARKLVDRLLSTELDWFKKAGGIVAGPETKTINDVEIVYYREYHNNLEGLVMFIDLGNGNIPSLAVTARKGEMAQFEKQLFAVASTFQYTPKPCNADTATPSH